MVPDTYTDFFVASAGVAGALIGLLFVAISVAPALTDPEKRLELDVRAGVAFSALTDALIVALVALVPGVSLGVTGIVVACSGFASCLALGIVLCRSAGVVHRGRQLRLLGVQSLVFLYQLAIAVQLADDPHDQSAVRTLAILTVVFFLVGIARAWQLIGARDTGLLRTVGEAIRERSVASDSAPVPVQSGPHVPPAAASGE